MLVIELPDCMLPRKLRWFQIDKYNNIMVILNCKALWVLCPRMEKRYINAIHHYYFFLINQSKLGIFDKCTLQFVVKFFFLINCNLLSQNRHNWYYIICLLSFLLHLFVTLLCGYLFCSKYLFELFWML